MGAVVAMGAVGDAGGSAESAPCAEGDGGVSAASASRACGAGRSISGSEGSMLHPLPIAAGIVDVLRRCCCCCRWCCALHAGTV
jgi:hypothetical protein